MTDPSHSCMVDHVNLLRVRDDRFRRFGKELESEWRRAL